MTYRQLLAAIDRVQDLRLHLAHAEQALKDRTSLLQNEYSWENKALLSYAQDNLNDINAELNQEIAK